MSPNEILAAIERKEVVMLNVPYGNYYIGQQGQLFSLNHASPKEIRPVRTNTGEYCVTLYVPELKSFKLAELMLTTFSRLPNPGETPCYRNCEPSDCRIDNLYWGDTKEDLKWRSELVVTQTRQVIGSFDETTSLSNVAMVKYYCNRAFMNDLSTFLMQLNRFLLSTALSQRDRDKLQRILSDISDMTTSTMLNVEKLRSLVDFKSEDNELRSLFEEFSNVLANNRAAYNVL